MFVPCQSATRLVVREALGVTSVLKFTPDAMPGADVKALHVGRTYILHSTLERIRSLISSGGTMNVIFVGQRGMGKTHMLQMIMHELSGEIVTASFAQEEYSIYTIDGFFSRVLEAIGEEYEGKDATRHARKVLKRRRSEGRPVVVFAENLQMLFAQMDADLGKLRSAMQEDESFFIVGSALSVFGQVTSMSAPLYNFFEINKLDGLSSDEIGELIRKRFCSRETLAKKMPLNRRRLEGLRVLTGGNPRLVHMLCDEMIGNNSIGDLEENLTTLLDQMTPVYQNKMETMPTEMRKIFDTLAMANGPLTPTEIALKMGTKNTITAAQISRMKNDGLVESVKFGRKRETRYQITEWLYRMWREFRRSRGSAKLQMFIGFLKLWYSEDRLRQEYERMSNEFESGKQNSDTTRMLMRMSRILAAMEGHGIVKLSETVERFRSLGKIDMGIVEIANQKNRAKLEKNKIRRLSTEIITIDVELGVCGLENRQHLNNTIQDKMRHLEDAMGTHARIPYTYDTHVLLGHVARVATRFDEWALVEKASGIALACIPERYCRTCTVLHASANTYLGEHEKALNTLNSALYNFVKESDVVERLELLSHRIHIYAKTKNYVRTSSDATYILEHDVGKIADVVSAYFELAKYDEACKIIQEHVPQLEQLKSTDLETAVADILHESVLHIIHRHPNESATMAISKSLRILGSFVSPNMFVDLAGDLVSHGYSMEELRMIVKMLSGAFADNQMSLIRILKCVTEYALTKDTGLFEKIHQEQRALALSILQEMSPSTEIPQHVLDSVDGPPRHKSRCRS